MRQRLIRSKVGAGVFALAGAVVPAGAQGAPPVNVPLVRATRPIISRRCCMAAEAPSKRGPNTLVSPSLVPDSLMAATTSLRRPARSKGFGETEHVSLAQSAAALQLRPVQ